MLRCLGLRCSDWPEFRFEHRFLLHNRSCPVKAIICGGVHLIKSPNSKFIKFGLLLLSQNVQTNAGFASDRTLSLLQVTELCHFYIQYKCTSTTLRWRSVVINGHLTVIFIALQHYEDSVSTPKMARSWGASKISCRKSLVHGVHRRFRVVKVS